LEPFLKRAHWLSTVVRGLANSDPPIRWHIYGKGPCEEKLRLELSALESHGSVFFHGWRDKQSLARELPAHDIFFLCSRSEGLPVAMVEAMLCGLACVVPAYPAGITYALEKGGGWLYEARSPEDCVSILRSAISDRSLLERKKTEARGLAFSLFAGPLVESYLNALETGVKSLTFNGKCLELDNARRMRAVHPWVSLRRRILTKLGFAPERF
jgi:glycosyltransferase involved in cell wall biosynthesis